MTTLKKIAKNVLDVQNACNLSGVVYAFARDMEVLCKEKLGTDARNRHCVSILYATQIAHLTGGGITHSDIYEKAYADCEALAQGPDVKERYAWSWEGGGYNSCMAYSKEDAIKQTKKSTPNLTINKSTLRIVSSEEMSAIHQANPTD